MFLNSYSSALLHKILTANLDDSSRLENSYYAQKENIAMNSAGINCLGFLYVGEAKAEAEENTGSGTTVAGDKTDAVLEDLVSQNGAARKLRWQERYFVLRGTDLCSYLKVRYSVYSINSTILIR